MAAIQATAVLKNATPDMRHFNCQ